MLLDLYTYGLRSAGGHKDRSQIIYTLFCVIHEKYESNYRLSVRKSLSRREYNSLQVSVTRSTMTLEKAGYLFRCASTFSLNSRHTSTLRRKFAFGLTALGRERAKELVHMEGLDPAKLNRRTLGGLLFRGAI